MTARLNRIQQHLFMTSCASLNEARKESTQRQSLLQSPNNSITPSCGAYKKRGGEKKSYSFSWKHCLNARFRCRSEKYETEENETQ